MNSTTTPHATRSTRLTVGAILLFLNGLTYVILEAITASAWRDPDYSYSYNYISDLGVPDVAEFQGRMIDSPLHLVMNTAFVLHGVVFIVAAALIWRAISRPGLRWAFLVLAVVHGAGISLVGLFHGSQAAVEDGTAVLHGLGALLAIVGGNAAAIIAGIDLLRQRVRPLGGAFLALGAIGIGAFAYLLSTSGTPVDGIPERIAVYTVMAAEIIAGTALVVRGRRSHRATTTTALPAGDRG
ncbi:DUF998 domain-containing protein [Leucobacter weissii]|uniref:DUF998 domain-containing protein n=1 Tax=Leucobacter weissii TaxID=1983706 RepID=A0A939MKK7_9MICO|nr:DUF998 domain-containing protein [Leucobacter weissii]MBO1902483.1 DUF998 domain-containing protein [Leucobacter weissii]